MEAIYRELRIEGKPDSILKFASELCSAYQSKSKHSSYFTRDGLHCFYLARNGKLDSYIKEKALKLDLEVRVIKKE